MKSSELIKTLEFHTKLAEKTAKTTDLHLLIESIINETISFTSASSGSIMVLDEEINSLKLYVSGYHPGIKKNRQKGPVASVPVNQGVAGKVLQSGLPILVESTGIKNKELKLSRSNDNGSFLSLPLTVNNRTIGVLNLNRDADKEGFNASDLEKLRSIDTLIAGLIEKEALLQTIETNRREISELYNLASILSQAADFTGNLEKFLTRLSEHLTLERSAIIKVSSPAGFFNQQAIKDGFEILAAHNLKPVTLHKIFDAVTDQMNQKLENTFAEFSEDSIQPPTLQFEDRNGMSELFCLPLVVEGRPSHMLLVSRSYQDIPADEACKHYRFLYLVSRNLSMAIERENMAERIREDQSLLMDSATRSNIFLEISKDLASTLDPYATLQRVFEKFRSLIRFYTISVLLFDDLEEVYRLIVHSENSLSPAFKSNLKNSIIEILKDFPVQSPISEENISNPIYYHGTDTHVRKSSKFKHCLHLPIIISENFRGLIHLTRLEHQPFSTNELQITSQFTGIFVTSIKNAMIHKRTEKLAFTDPLTELFNHRYFQETLSHEFIRARRYGKPLSLMVIDIDFFKKFNDTYGHLVGDKVLKHVAGLLRTSVRELIDTVARYGGEEFVVILPETSIEGAGLFAERIRATVEKSIITEGNQKLSVKLSIGVSCTTVTHCEKTSDLIEAADIALYQAKDNGRNQVQLYKESSIEHGK